MSIRNIFLFFPVFLIALYSSLPNADCIPYPASTGNVDQDFTCTGNITAWQYFYGGSDKVELNSVTGNTVYWLDDANHGSPTDGSIFGFMHILMILFFTLSIGSYFIYKDERSSEWQ